MAVGPLPRVTRGPPRVEHPPQFAERRRGGTDAARTRPSGRGGDGETRRMPGSSFPSTTRWVSSRLHGVVSGLESGVSHRGIHMFRSTVTTLTLYLPKYCDFLPKRLHLSSVQILTFACKKGKILLAVAPRNACTLGSLKVHQAN